MKVLPTIVGFCVVVIAPDLLGHGSAVYPPSRVYRVYQSNPSNPNFQLAANAVAMDGELSYYTWNEVSRNIPAAVNAGLPAGFDYSPWLPDGQIASGGRVDPNSSEYPRTYAGLDQVSTDWPSTPVNAGETIVVDFLATAVHEPSVWDVWMTRPGWDSASPLTWSEMEFLGRPDPSLNGQHYTFDLEIPADRSGHQVLWIAWQRDDAVGEVFFSTSDIDVQRTEALYGGTGEDLQLASGTPGNLSSTPPNDVKYLATGNTWEVEVSSPHADFVGDTAVVVAKALSAGWSLPPLFGTLDVFLDPYAGSRIIVSSALPAGGESVRYFLPPSTIGRSFAFQGMSASSAAANGSYASTDVHLLHIVN